MSRILSALVATLLACSAYAQNEGMGGGPPSETVSLVWVAVFGVLFVGMIAVFVVYLYMNERKRKGEEAGAGNAKGM